MSVNLRLSRVRSAVLNIGKKFRKDKMNLISRLRLSLTVMNLHTEAQTNLIEFHRRIVFCNGPVRYIAGHGSLRKIFFHLMRRRFLKKDPFKAGKGKIYILLNPFAFRGIPLPDSNRRKAL